MGADGPAPATTDAALVERARGGDAEAFERLVEMHVPRVWKVVWRILRHHEDCEDVVQEVFLTAWQALPSYRGEARFSTWLHTIAVTRALNHLDRAAEKVRRVSDPLEPPEGDGLSPALVRAVDPAGAVSRDPTPLQDLEAGELMRRLAECLARLPGAWRAVLALRDAEDHSYEEIAALLGLALGTVRSRLARARIALRECVEGRAS